MVVNRKADMAGQTPDAGKFYAPRNVEVQGKIPYEFLRFPIHDIW
jgi:hypothetical protein